MKSLKQALSVTLAAALLAGTLTVAAGAEEAVTFTDAGQIGQWEAVAALTRLGVVSGKDNGSFDPAGSVTRGEAAKLLAVLLTGGDAQAIPAPETSTYTDAAGHWAETYIEYCSAKGLLAGAGDGTVAPDGLVTGAQLMKMALVSLGYDPEVYLLTGQDWEINVNVQARGLPLYDGLEEMEPSEPATREETARVLFNMLSAAVMEARPYQDEETGEEPLLIYAPKTDDQGKEVSFLAEYFPGADLSDLPGQPGKGEE